MAVIVRYGTNKPGRPYQQHHVHIEFDLPDGVSLADGFFLAKVIVNWELGKHDLVTAPDARAKADKLYAVVFGGQLQDHTPTPI